MELGVDIRLSSHVSSYWETDEAAGVICNGERLTADAVVGADGVRSAARAMVLVRILSRLSRLMRSCN